MNPKDFRSSSTGKVIRTPQGYAAFIPAPLPPLLVYDDDLAHALSRADAALRERSGLVRHPPNPHQPIAPYVRRQAALSSRMAGTMASLPDLRVDHPQRAA